MHRKHKWTLAAFGLLLAASTAVAQQPQNVRVRARSRRWMAIGSW